MAQMEGGTRRRGLLFVGARVRKNWDWAIFFRPARIPPSLSICHPPWSTSYLRIYLHLQQSITPTYPTIYYRPINTRTFNNHRHRVSYRITNPTLSSTLDLLSCRLPPSPPLDPTDPHDRRSMHPLLHGEELAGCLPGRFGSFPKRVWRGTASQRRVGWGLQS
jgi:hypothetical protein